MPYEEPRTRYESPKRKKRASYMTLHNNWESQLIYMDFTFYILVNLLESTCLGENKKTKLKNFNMGGFL